MNHYRVIISAIWWGAGLTIIAVFLWLASNQTSFGDFSSQALDWLLPQLVPTMTLTGAVAVAHPGKRGGTGRPMRHAFLLTCVVSIFYLALVVADIAHAFLGTAESDRGVLDALNEWNKILGVFQGIAASAIGVFFVRGGAGD